MKVKNYFLLSLFLILGFIAVGQTLGEMRQEAKTKFLVDGDGNVTDLLYALGQQVDPTLGAWLTDQTYNGKLIEGIDYDDLTESSWKPMTHLKRLRKLCEVYAANPGSASTELIDGIVNGLKYWYEEYENTSQNAPFDLATLCDAYAGESGYSPATTVPWCCDNWFKNYIEKQRNLERIGILFYDYLIANAPTLSDGTTTLLSKIIGDLPTSIEDADDPGDFYTGANKTDVVGSMIIRGLLADDPAMVRKGRDELECALEFASIYPDYDGVQRDYSFYQHDKVLYNGGYGQSFIERTAMFGAILMGDDYGLHEDNTQLLFDFVLEGNRWMIIGNTMDYSANGRYIARVYPDNNAAIPLPIYGLLNRFG